MKRLVDSNVLIYAFDDSDEKRHTIAKNVIADSVKENTGAISIQNLAELSRALTERAKNPLNHNIVRSVILYFQDVLEVLIYNPHTVANALSIASIHKIHFFDALIAATMEENRITEIITENEKDFTKIPWIKVINPFKK